MKIALLGLGKTGSVVAEIAKERGHQVFVIDPSHPSANAKSILPDDLQDCAVCIDFSNPEAVLENIKKVCALGKPIVVGTTGWYKQLAEARHLVESANSALLYASNFSPGVNVFNEIVAAAAKIMNKFEQYDVAGLEAHHSQKADSPSGTAHTLAEILLENLDRKTTILNAIGNRKIQPDELLFTSVRCGAIPGTHEVIFDSEADSISLKHSARNRTGFALGAVLAAEWLLGKKGFFTARHFFTDIIGGGK